MCETRGSVRALGRINSSALSSDTPSPVDRLSPRIANFMNAAHNREIEAAQGPIMATVPLFSKALA